MTIVKEEESESDREGGKGKDVEVVECEFDEPKPAAYDLHCGGT